MRCYPRITRIQVAFVVGKYYIPIVARVKFGWLKVGIDGFVNFLDETNQLTQFYMYMVFKHKMKPYENQDYYLPGV